jgi:hypothetical protein
MLRIARLEHDDSAVGESTPIVFVTFEGMAGRSALCTFRLKLKDRQDDATLLRDAQRGLREAVNALAQELNDAPGT